MSTSFVGFVLKKLEMEEDDDFSKRTYHAQAPNIPFLIYYILLYDTVKIHTGHISDIN